MPENEELTDIPAFEVEDPPGVDFDDETEDTEAGDDSPTDSDTTPPDDPDEPDDDALDDAAILRLMKRGKWAQPQQQPDDYQPEEEPEVPDPMLDPLGYAKWVRDEVAKENEPSLRPYLGATIEKNVREAVKKAKVDLPEEAFELLRSQAETFPMDALRMNSTPEAAKLIAFNLMESFEPVQKPKAKPVGASVTSGIHAANPSPNAIVLKGEDADAWREWQGTFGDTPETRKRFLKAIGRSK